MARSKYNYDELKAGGFATSDRGHLVRAHETMFGYAPDDADATDDIRLRLRIAAKQEAQGEALKGKEPEPQSPVPRDIVAEATDAKVIPFDTKAQPLSLKKMPNLSPNGRWEGRWRRVRWMQDPKDACQVITARWETLQQDLIAGKVTDMPWPLYKNIFDAVEVHMDDRYRKYKIDDTPGPNEGRLMLIDNTKTVKKYNIDDMGDVPGTEDLPESYFDYFQRVAKQTNMFEGVTRSLLLKVYNLLYGQTPISELQGVSDLDLRGRIAERLGPDYEQLLVTELYGKAEGA